MLQSNRHPTIGVWHTNSRGLASSIDELRQQITSGGATFVGITETWIHRDHVNTTAFNIDGYRLLSHPRQRAAKGGGVGLYVSSKVNARVIARSEADSVLEFLFAECYFNGDKIAIGVAYNPPPAHSLFDYDNFENIITSINTSHDITLLMGDFNVNMCEAASSRAEDINLFWRSQNITPVTFDFTRYGFTGASSLDMFATNHPERVESKTKIAAGFSDHDIICISLFVNTTQQQQNPLPLTFYDYNNINRDELYRHANNLNWSEIWNEAEIDEKIAMLNERIYLLHEHHVPVKSTTIRNRRVPWWTAELEALIVLRDIA